MKEKQKNVYQEIDEKFHTINSMKVVPYYTVKRFLEDFSISACHNSTAIEGNTFTYDETLLLIKERVTSAKHSIDEHNEIVGYKKAFDFLYKAQKDGVIITEDFVKKLHSYVMLGQENAGQYRDIQVYIGDLFQAKYTPPAPSKLSGLMQEYVANLQVDFQYLKVIKAEQNIDWIKVFHMLARHHIEFERIHPFTDGNGRTGRLVLSYEIINTGLLPIDIRYEERERYYSALKQFQSKSKYSTRDESKTEALADLIAECELRSMNVWLDMFLNYNKDKFFGQEDER